MERSEEFMNLLDKSRHVLKLPLGEWMFPGPISEPHFIMFYGDQQIPSHIEVRPPPSFVATEATLFMTTEQDPGKERSLCHIRLLCSKEHQ